MTQEMKGKTIGESQKRFLLVTAVPVEREAVLRGLKQDDRFEVLVVGVGPISSAANTARFLTGAGFDLVISLGIGGGFAGKAEVGSLVIAETIIAADLGVETPEGFNSLDELGFGLTCIQVDTAAFNKVKEALVLAKLPVNIGPVLTVSTATGTAESAAKLSARVPGAAAEAMEGYGVALAANLQGIPVLELRAISNLVGPRDRKAWRIEEALKVLEEASFILSEVL